MPHVQVVVTGGRSLHGSQGAALQAHLKRQPGIHQVAVDAKGGTLTVEYDEAVILKVEVYRLIEECGYHCRVLTLPVHRCPPDGAIP